MSLKKNEVSNRKAIKYANGNVGLTKKYGNKIGSQSNQRTKDMKILHTGIVQCKEMNTLHTTTMQSRVKLINATDTPIPAIYG